MASATAEQPKLALKGGEGGDWRPLTPTTGPLAGLMALDVPRCGTIIWGPSGMFLLPGIKPALNERDANGGYKLVKRGDC